jgi:drug/metabolite transporter (DMT)-like permease
VPLWFPIALCCAFFTACCDAISKRIMLTSDEWLTGGILLTLASLMLTPVLFYVDLRPVTSEGAILLAVTLPLEALAYYMFLSAIRMSALSLVAPLLAFTPAFTIVTASLLLGESIGAWGLCGVSIVTLGAYILNVDPSRFSLLGPVRMILSDPGARRMLLVSAIWSVTSALGKKGALIFGSLQYGFILTAMIGGLFLLIGTCRIKLTGVHMDFDNRLVFFFILGAIFMALQEITHFVSISMAPVAYMISVKRLSMIIAVIFGWRFFDERNVVNRLAGASIMLLGVFIIYGFQGNGFFR